MASEGDSARGEPDSAYDLRRTDRPSEAVYTAVAVATGQSPLDIDPLAGVIDPDALDAMLDAGDRPSSPGSTPSGVTVSFDYCGCRVTVTRRAVRVDIRT